MNIYRYIDETKKLLNRWGWRKDNLYYGERYIDGKYHYRDYWYYDIMTGNFYILINGKNNNLDLIEHWPRIYSKNKSNKLKKKIRFYKKIWDDTALMDEEAKDKYFSMVRKKFELEKDF